MNEPVDLSVLTPAVYLTAVTYCMYVRNRQHFCIVVGNKDERQV